MRSPVRQLQTLARRRRRITRADLADFGAALLSRDRLSACRAVVDGAVVVTTLERRGLRPLLRERSELTAAEPAAARRVAAAVDAGLGVLPVKGTCLRRSVTLLRELHRRGLGGALHIGVRPGPAGIEAHAWVQVGDDIVNDEPEVVATYSQLSAGDAERLLPRLA